MLVSKFILTPLSSLGLCDAKLEGYQGESAPLFLCVHPNNCPVEFLQCIHNLITMYAITSPSSNTFLPPFLWWYFSGQVQEEQ